MKKIEGKNGRDQTFTKYDTKASDFIHNLTMKISILETCRKI
jgi:hypothetical protein